MTHLMDPWQQLGFLYPKQQRISKVEHLKFWRHPAILVLILPSQGKRIWTPDELRIVQVVADQLAVALSHAAMFEKLQLTRDHLTNQNKALRRARQDALMASQARHLFKVVINHEMRTPLHSISAASSLLQARSTSSEQRVIVDMLARSCNLLSSFLKDAMDWSHLEDAHLVLELHPFQLPLMLKEAENLSKHMCVTNGHHFVLS
jgi:ethylene receptor